MRLTVGESRLRMSQNCSPSALRLAKERFDSETKNSDRLNNRGCSRTTSDIMVEPQRPVLTMKTGGFMRMPSSSSHRTAFPGALARAPDPRGRKWHCAPGCKRFYVTEFRRGRRSNFGKLVAVEPGEHLLDGGERGAGRKIERRHRPAHQDHRQAERARRGDLAVGRV